MIARISLPGCQDHDWERFETREDCREWLAKTLSTLEFSRDTKGIRRGILTEKQAAAERYADGSAAYPIQPKIGRPAKPPGEKYETPARQLGRVSDSDWHEIKEAAEAAGESVVNWALPTLLRKARRERKGQ